MTRFLILLAFFLSVQLPVLASPAIQGCGEILNLLVHRQNSVSSTSLIEKFPELKDGIETLKPEQLDLLGFIENFSELNKRAPSIRETLDYAYENRRNLHQAYDDLLSQLKTFEDEAAVRFSKEVETSRLKLSHFYDLDKLSAEVKSDFEKGKTKISSLDEPIPTEVRGNKVFFDEQYYQFLLSRTSLGLYSGEYGELKAFISTPDWNLKRGLRFDQKTLEITDEYQNLIMDRVNTFEQTLNRKSAIEVKALLEKYNPESGTGLLRQAREYLERTDPAQFNIEMLKEKILQAVKSKEIDLVGLSAENKVIWSEVKAFHKSITLESLHKRSGNKSLYEQLVEHKVVRDILGLTELVELRLLSTMSHVEEDAIRELAKIGYKVNMI